MAPKVKANLKYLYVGILLGVLILTSLVGLFFISLPKKPGKLDNFAKCLSDKGAQMYGAYWCPHCQNTKKEFGGSWKYVKYNECSLPNAAGETQVCKDAGIQGYPTWVLGDGSKLEGEVSIQELANKTGCNL